MREAGIGRVLVASLHQGIADILPTRLGLLRELVERRGPARRHHRAGAALRRAQFSAAGRGRRLRHDHDARRRLRRGVDRAVDATGRASAHQIRAHVAARTARSARGEASRARELPGQPRGREDSQGDGERGCARVHFLHGSRAGGAAALRFLRRGVHEAPARSSTLPTRAVVVRCRGTGEPSCVLEIALADLVSAPNPEVEAA